MDSMLHFSDLTNGSADEPAACDVEISRAAHVQVTAEQLELHMAWNGESTCQDRHILTDAGRVCMNDADASLGGSCEQSLSADKEVTCVSRNVAEEPPVFVTADAHADVIGNPLEEVVRAESMLQSSSGSLHSSVESDVSATDADMKPPRDDGVLKVSESDVFELFSAGKSADVETADGSGIGIASPHCMHAASDLALDVTVRCPDHDSGGGARSPAAGDDVFLEQASYAVQDLNSERNDDGNFEAGYEFVGNPAQVLGPDVGGQLPDSLPSRHASSVVSLDSNVENSSVAPSCNSHFEAARNSSSGDFCELQAASSQPSGDTGLDIGTSASHGLAPVADNLAFSLVEVSELETVQKPVCDFAVGGQTSISAVEHTAKNSGSDLQAYALVGYVGDLVREDSATDSANVVLLDSTEEFAFAGIDGEIRDAVILRHSSVISLDSNSGNMMFAPLSNINLDLAQEESAQKESYLVNDYCELFGSAEEIGDAVVEKASAYVEPRPVAIAEDLELELGCSRYVEDLSSAYEKAVDSAEPCGTGVPATVDAHHPSDTLWQVPGTSLSIGKVQLSGLVAAEIKAGKNEEVVNSAVVAQLQDENYGEAKLNIGETSLESAITFPRNAEVSGSCETEMLSTKIPRSGSPPAKHSHAFPMPVSEVASETPLSAEVLPCGRRSPPLRRRSHEHLANVEGRSERKVRSVSLVDMPSTATGLASTSAANDRRLLRKTQAYLSGSIVNIDLRDVWEAGTPWPTSPVPAIDSSDESASDMDELSMTSSCQESASSFSQQAASGTTAIADDELAAYDIIDRSEIKQVESETKDAVLSSTLFSALGLRESIRRKFSPQVQPTDVRRKDQPTTRSGVSAMGVAGIWFRFSMEKAADGEPMQVVNVHRGQLESDFSHKTHRLSDQRDVHVHVGHDDQPAHGIPHSSAQNVTIDPIKEGVLPPASPSFPYSERKSMMPDVMPVVDVPVIPSVTRSSPKSALSAPITRAADVPNAPALSYSKQKSVSFAPDIIDSGSKLFDGFKSKRNTVHFADESPLIPEVVGTSISFDGEVAGSTRSKAVEASSGQTVFKPDTVIRASGVEKAEEATEDADDFEKVESKSDVVDQKVEEPADSHQTVVDGQDKSTSVGEKDFANKLPGVAMRHRKGSTKISQTFSTGDRVVKPSPASLVTPRRVTISDPDIQTWAESMLISPKSSPIIPMRKAGKDALGPSDKLSLMTDSYPALMPSFPSDRHSCVALEIYTTERTYVRGLEILVKLFKRKLSGANILDSKEIGMIFANIEAILAFNTELLGSVFDRISTWSDEEKIGDIFLQHENRFKMYAEYCKGYDAGEALLKQKLKKKKDLENLLNACYKYPACSPGLTISSYLITVIQRIPRYILLLKDLAKRTDVDHPDQSNLVAACAMMEKVAQYLNQQLSESQSKKALEALQTQIVGLKAYYIPERTLVRQGPVCLMTSKKTYQCVLFNDLLVFAVKAANKPSEVELALELTTVWFEDLADLDPQTIKQDAIEISTPDRPFTMYVGTAGEKKLWLQHLRNAIEQHLTNLHEEAISDPRKEEVRKASYTYSSGAMYSGDFLDARRHGQGMMIWPNQVSYQGAWEDDEMNGYGILQYLSGDVYEGNWRDNQQAGLGTLRYANGDVYCGEWRNGLRHGKAVVTFKNGDMFDGLFAHGRIDGRGELTCKSGMFYSGQWKKNMKHGKGELKTPDGCEYKGTFLRDQYHDKGELTYPNGAVYKGDFEQGVRCGYGSYTVPGGCSYEGQWMNDLMDGRGRITFENGDSYDGTWVHNERTGQGTMVYNYGGYYRGQWFADQCHGSGFREFKDGSTYDGMWEHGKMHGHGKVKYGDGRRYIGSWKDGMYHGQGVLKKSKGWYYDGMWAQGQQHGRGTLCDTLNGYMYEGEWVNGLKKGKGEERTNNVVFVGEFSNDQRNGFGKETFPDGSTYEGNWLHGQKHGTGTVTTLKRVMEKQVWVHGTLVDSPQMFNVPEIPIISRW